MQENRVNKFRTIFSKVSSFVGNPVFIACILQARVFFDQSMCFFLQLKKLARYLSKMLDTNYSRKAFSNAIFVTKTFYEK